MAVDCDRGFGIVEARAVYFRLPKTCSPIDVDKWSLKTRWTSTPGAGKVQHFRVGQAHEARQTSVGALDGNAILVSEAGYSLDGLQRPWSGCCQGKCLLAEFKIRELLGDPEIVVGVVVHRQSVFGHAD